MNRDKSILGIHIDDDFLNIVQLERTADGLQVHGWASEPLEEGAIKEGLIVQDETIAQKIRDFLQAKKLKTHKAIMSPSFATVRLKPSEFSAQTDEHLSKQVEDQIRKYALFGNEEIVFDYCTFEQAVQASNKRTVLEAVTTRRISNACLRVAQQARLDLIRIEPAVLPIIKLIYDKVPVKSDGVSLLLALDSRAGSMCVFKDGLPQFCQNLSVGVKDISQDEGNFACLTEQIKPVLEFAHSLGDSQQLLLRILASCSSKKLSGIVGRIKQDLSDVAAEQIDSAQIKEKFDIKGADEEDLPIFALASALTALGVFEFTGQLNLVSEESAALQKTQKQMSLTAKTIIGIVLLSVVAVIPLKMKIRSVEADSAEIEAKMTETIPMKQRIIGLTEQIEQLKEMQRAYAVAGEELVDIAWPQALQIIGNTVPDKVRIVDISTSDSADFTLVGEALAESDVYRFAKKLQNAELIDSAKVEEIEYDAGSTEGIVDYKITCKIRLPEGNL